MLCLKKYAEGGVENALFDAPGRGRNAEITDDEKAWIINIACQKPKDLGYSAETWTYAKLTSHINKNAEEAGYMRLSTIHKSTVHIEFLKILDDKYPKGDKIRLVLDNLRVHSSEETRKYLVTVPGRFEFVFTPKHGSWLNMVEVKIDLVFLPPYSPNLNLIERLWKFTKGKLRVKYYGDFKTFRDTIDFIICGCDTVYKEQISNLISERIQLFDKLEPVCDNTYEFPDLTLDQAA